MKTQTLFPTVLITLLAAFMLLSFSASAEARPKKARRAEAKKALDAKPESSLKVFRLQNAVAPVLAKTVMPLFAGTAESRIVMVCDERTNVIIARGSDAELKVLEALLIQLDEPTDSGKAIK